MEILEYNKDYAICIKPVGVDAEHDVPRLLKEALGGEIFPIHRLDLNVGGVMVYARTKQAAAEFSRLVQEGKMVKEYVALVHGQPPKQGDWTDLLFKDSHRNKVFVVDRQRSGVKEARLEFTCEPSGEYSLAHIRLHTGRSHQIRVQFSSRGFPLVGDHKYGAKDDIPSPMLHSCRITFPYKGETKFYTHLPIWAENTEQ